MNTPSPFPNSRMSGALVLVVDDVKRNLQVVSAVLTEKKYAVMVAADGEAALAEIEKQLPDIILLDLMMPGLSGLDVCRRLKANPRTRDIPVIFLTAAGEKKLVAEALQLGAVDYVTKPFHAAELLARVGTHIELKRTRDELRHIIEQKNDLMSAVAHDLKNPISAVRFSALLLREGVADPARQAEFINTIVVSCEASLAFINERLERNAREFAVSRLNLGPVALVEAFLSVEQQNSAAATAKKIELKVDLASAAEMILHADHQALGRVIDNLVSNAIKFTPPGKAVDIRAVPAADRKFARIEVRDEGPGLTDEDRAHLFEPYRRLSAQPTGGEPSTGLGLNITHRLVTTMGGRIGCESKPGEGACFWAELPLATGI